MASQDRAGQRSTRMLGTVAAGALAVACCAGLPLVVGAVGSLTLAAALGIGGGLLVAGLGAAIALTGLRARRRRACNPESGRHPTEVAKR